MEKGCLALKQKKASIFVIFGTSMMILHNTTLQRPFPKLKKHHPTNLFMLYPMAQSVWLVFIEIDKKMTPQWHCGKMVDFGDCSRTVLAFFAPENDAHEALSSWKMEVLL
jgi:hypothetical protein